MARVAGLAIALCLGTAAPAWAAFAPELRVGLNPPTAASVPAIDATVSGLAGGAPVQRFTLTLPSRFAPTGAPGTSVCPPASAALGSCVPSARVGVVEGRTVDGTPLAGWINKVAGDQYLAFVSTFGGAVKQVVPVTLARRSSGAVDMKIDQLPALALSTISFRFAGGGHGVLRTPKQCGTYTRDGKFTSRTGELAIARRNVTIIGCDDAPAVAVENVTLSRHRFRPGPYRTTIGWTASAAAERTDL